MFPKLRSKTLSKSSLTTFTLILAIVTSAIGRFFTNGPFIPISCSVLGINCSGYKVPFEGYVHDDYAEAGTAFKDNFYRGEDVGASVAAYVDNRLVLNMQGGWQDIDKNIPYTTDTLQIVFSSTKMVTAIVIAQLVEKGALSYDEKIVHYWPEFGQGNKMDVTLGDLMQHAGGVGHLDHPITSAEAEDPARFSQILAAQPHNFKGIRTRSYHAVTRGWYLNEILKRATTENYTIDEWIHQHINHYYQDVEWHLKPYQAVYDKRISPIYRGPILHRLYRLVKSVLQKGPGKLREILAMLDQSRLEYKTLRHSTLDGIAGSALTSLRYRRIEGPSYSGFTNAISIAKLAAMMANGGRAIVAGEPDLMNATTYALATEPMPLEYDMLIKRRMAALKGGFGVMDDLAIDNVTFVGWTGMGGSIFFWNQDYRIGFGYCTNTMPSFQPADARSMSILRALVKQAKKARRSESN